MAEIDRFRPADRRQIDALYRRVFGPDVADATRLRWDWQFTRNPRTPADGPLIWVAREAGTVVGHYAAIPVRVALHDAEIDAAWGTDVMVAPERRRQGLADALIRTWDRQVGAAIGLGLPESSEELLRKLRWPMPPPVRSLVKPLSRRALRHPAWPIPINRFISYVTYPWVRLVARLRPLEAEVRLVRQFDDGFTRLWDRVGRRFAFAVRRDAAYLNWKYVQPPHVRYNIAALVRDGEAAGYAVYRHVAEPRQRVTLLVDFLTDPDDQTGLQTLLRWVDREARQADSDKIRTFVFHDGFRRVLKKSGYYSGRRSLNLVAKINAVTVSPAFYTKPDNWHVTLGDGDQDR